MAGPILVPDEQNVYRGMRNKNWSKNGIVNYRAFMLRPATDQFPIEEELSLGLTPESAVDELQEHHGIAGILVRRIHLLPHHLTVQPDSENATKADIHGLPQFSTDPVQRDLAMTVATDLAKIVHQFMPPNEPA